MSRCTIIAEAGVNHNGRLDLALKLIDVAKAAGADIVKFQTFDADQLVSESAEKAEYQKKQTGEGSQLDMLKKLQLSKDEYIRIFGYAKSVGIKCISTPFDVKSLDFLITLGMDIVKIPSGEVTNGPFLLEIARRGLPVILSTGMCTLEDIEKALAVLAYGFDNSSATPSSIEECLQLWREKFSKEDRFKKLITILHCTTNYPALFEEINLNAMVTIQNTFALPVGYSDHSLGLPVPIIAASMGATIIEKHITLDKEMEGPDHAASLEPHELEEMVAKIREVELIQGSYNKGPSEAEVHNSKIARRGIYAARDIALGDSLSQQNVEFLRPMTDKSPMEFWGILNTKSAVQYKRGSAI